MGKGGNGEGEDGNWGNSALVVGGIDAPGLGDHANPPQRHPARLYLEPRKQTRVDAAADDVIKLLSAN